MSITLQLPCKFNHVFVTQSSTLSIIVMDRKSPTTFILKFHWFHLPLTEKPLLDITQKIKTMATVQEPWPFPSSQLHLITSSSPAGHRTIFYRSLLSLAQENFLLNIATCALSKCR